MTLGRHPKFSHKVTSKSSDHELILGKLMSSKKKFRDSMLHRLIRRVLKGLQYKKENLL